MSEIKCEECGTSNFRSTEYWDVVKDTYIYADTESWESIVVDEDFGSSEDYACENNHTVSLDVAEELRKLEEKIRWD